MRFALVLGLAASLGAASGCTVAYRSRASGGATYSTAATVAIDVPAYVEVTSQPPPAREVVVVRPTQPDGSAVWVEAHYEWSGNAWVWVDGRWETGRAGHEWVDPVVVVERGQTRYHPGYWRRREHPPAAPYRHPGAVIVAARGTRVEPTRQGGTPVEPTRQGGTPVEPTRQGGTPVEPTRQGGVAVRPGGTPVEPTRQGGTPVEPTRQGGTPVEPTRRGGGVTATPAGPTAPNRYDAPDANAQGGQGTVTVRGGGTPPSGSVTVRGGGSTTVRGGGTASSGTGTSRGDTTPNASGASGTVRGGTVYTPDARPATGNPPVTARTDQGGSATTPRPAVTPRTEQGGSATTPRPPTVAVTDQGGSATTPRPATTVRTDQGGSATTPRPRPPAGTTTTVRPQDPGTDVDPQTIALTCSVTTPRAPRGGAVTIRGTGFRRPTVRIGGQVVRIATQSATELVVTAPNMAGGGDVRVTDVGREATCGRIDVR